MHTGGVTGKGKDVQELKSSFGQVLPLLFGGFISALPASKGSNQQKHSCEDFFSFEVWGENYPFPKNLSCSHIQTRTVPAPRQSSGISECRWCRATCAGLAEGNMATAWPGFIMSFEEALPVHWDPQQGYFPRWGQGGQEATCSWSPGPRPPMPLAFWGLKAFAGEGPPH